MTSPFFVIPANAGIPLGPGLRRDDEFHLHEFVEGERKARRARPAGSAFASYCITEAKDGGSRSEPVDTKLARETRASTILLGERALQVPGVGAGGLAVVP
jgi:hypothetical protein